MDPASVTLVRGDNPRYASAETLQALWGPREVLDIAAAARRLREPLEADGSPRLVCGSLYFIGDLLKAL
jgi:folylpolyglutamate synthase/dihydropteroate synthase